MQAERRSSRLWRLIVLVGWLLCISLPCGVTAEATIVNVALSANPTALRVKLEVSFEVTNAVFSNPFDPSIANVQATFASPSSQTWTTPCFWYQNYSRSGNTNSESTTAVGSPFW